MTDTWKKQQWWRCGSLHCFYRQRGNCLPSCSWQWVPIFHWQTFARLHNSLWYSASPLQHSVGWKWPVSLLGNYLLHISFSSGTFSKVRAGRQALLDSRGHAPCKKVKSGSKRSRILGSETSFSCFAVHWVANQQIVALLDWTVGLTLKSIFIFPNELTWLWKCVKQITYCIARKFDGESNLVVWRSGLKLPNKYPPILFCPQHLMTKCIH